MPDLTHCLYDHDLGFLRIIAELWGTDLNAPDARHALPILVRTLLDPSLAAEVVESLPDESRQAVDALIHNSGWMTWSRFTREYGFLRDMGPGKRDREKPYLDPTSAAEVLWYCGLIGRDFLKREGKLQECAYIPDDLLALLPSSAPAGSQPPGRPASPGEQAYPIEVTDRILDHACTLLAALRLEDPHRSPMVDEWEPPLIVVNALLGAMKLITSSEQPVPEDAQPFLEMSRGEALAWLVRNWRTSTLFNELRLLPGIICEGAWQNDPQAARESLLAFLSEIPEGRWWSLDSFVNGIHEREPDFQRPAGDFDTWLIRRADTGESLQGIKHWESVDGAMIRYLITGPMHWLGLMDLASALPGEPVAAFRLSPWAPKLLLGKPVDLPEENQSMSALSEGIITAGRFTPRLVRYQVSRFCLWVEENEDQYVYQLTPASLLRAADQGLKIIHLKTLLKKHCETPPPSLLKALNQWDKKGGQVRIHPGIILRVETPQILQALRESPAGRFLGDPLGPTSAIVHPGAVKKVTAALARLGYLSDVEMLGVPGFPSDELEL